MCGACRTRLELFGYNTCLDQAAQKFIGVASYRRFVGVELDLHCFNYLVAGLALAQAVIDKSAAL